MSNDSSNDNNNGTPTTAIEYSLYLDSHNRAKNVHATEPDNPTNDIQLEIPASINRLPVSHIYLSSLEIPLAQKTVESKWNNLYFDEGLDLISSTTEFLDITRFVISENGTMFTAQLPARFNPIIAVDTATIPGATVFTTSYPHRLELREKFTWGEPMQLISTPLTDPAFTNLTTTDALTILSDTTFQLDTTATYTAFGDFFGYVLSPTIPSPEYLATLVQAAIDLEIPGHWRIMFSRQTGKFTICYVGLVCDVENITPVQIVIPGSGSLPSIMGFGDFPITIPLQGYRQVNANTNLILDTNNYINNLSDDNAGCLIALNCYRCKTWISVDPGNYNTGESLASNLALQWNRFFFDSACNNAADPVNFVFSNHEGTCFDITITPGMYTPETIAEFLETQMNATDTSSTTYTVTWDNTTGQLVFSADAMFGLEFGDLDVNSTSLPARFGFKPVCYRSGTRYASTMPFQTPTKGCCSTNIPDRFISFVYMPVVSSTNQSVSIQKCKTRCQIATVTDSGNSLVTFVTTFAHGYQPNDMVEVTVTSTGDVFLLRVLSVPDFQTFVADAGSAPFTGFASEPVTVCFGGNVVGNLYFSADCNLENQFPGRLLGFLAEEYLWNVNFPTVWESVTCWELSFPNYLLFEIQQPYGATRNEHEWDSDNLSSILGKIILYPQYRMERLFPMNMYLPDLRILKQIRVRLLNPDHTLYQLHGCEWSWTLGLNVIQKSGRLLCY